MLLGAYQASQMDVELTGNLLLSTLFESRRACGAPHALPVNRQFDVSTACLFHPHGSTVKSSANRSLPECFETASSTRCVICLGSDRVPIHNSSSRSAMRRPRRSRFCDPSL